MTKVCWMSSPVVLLGLSRSFGEGHHYTTGWLHSFVCSTQDEYDSYVFVYRAKSWGER